MFRRCASEWGPGRRSGWAWGLVSALGMDVGTGVGVGLVVVNVQTTTLDRSAGRTLPCLPCLAPLTQAKAGTAWNAHRTPAQ